MHSEIFTKFILGQKVIGMGWMQPTTDNRYVGGYYVEYENGYRTVTKGGGKSGEDYVNMFILDEKGDKIEEYEQCVY